MWGQGVPAEVGEGRRYGKACRLHVSGITRRPVRW